MKNLHIDWSSVPDVIKKDHFFGICHISKSTALHSLKSYKENPLRVHGQENSLLQNQERGCAGVS